MVSANYKTIRNKKKTEDGEVILEYKPSLPYKIIKRVCGGYVLVFYLGYTRITRKHYLKRKKSMKEEVKTNDTIM